MVAMLDWSERDAMKPVEEIVLLVDGEEEGEGAQEAPNSPGADFERPAYPYISNSHSLATHRADGLCAVYRCRRRSKCL
jgi:hypothetical protein